MCACVMCALATYCPDVRAQSGPCSVWLEAAGWWEVQKLTRHCQVPASPPGMHECVK